ncbi:MAG: DNA mismatch repair endonuclease MutH [Glaciecola sp.]|jgi:DNA mismatch repair protein MutH|nr:DNA mismatch repair endonuclease MutH [Glaciecola sp.]MDG2100322.1 DNA mismatch repair endonuclease MutH [Glaciecola sp.]
MTESTPNPPYNVKSVQRPPTTAPTSSAELFARAEIIAGRTLGELGDNANVVVPEHFKQHKGFTGQLIELWLGASAGSKQQQDFPELGIELKTIPIDHQGQVLETTYVCYVHLLAHIAEQWDTSAVRNKLAQVLFIPVVGERSIAPRDRQLGMPILWQPNAQELALLAHDWEELMELISLGKVEQITAKMGEALHIRPKAANGKALTDAIGNNGQTIQTRPRGFYLRKPFTQAIINRAFGL